jgi:hypothetical protein
MDLWENNSFVGEVWAQQNSMWDSERLSTLISVEELLDNWTTKIVIENALWTVKNIESWTECNVNILTIFRKKLHVNLFHRFSNLSNAKKVEIFLRKWKLLEKVELSEEMLTKISEFIRFELSEKQVRDCIAFAHFINWVDYTIWDSFEKYVERWNWIDKIDEESSLKVWDTIMIIENNIEEKWFKVTHFATYLWNWLYLSKFWDIWNLMVTSLEEMKKFFCWNIIFRVNP